jgi:hypothetical protein
MIVSFWIYYTFLASSNISKKKKLKEKKKKRTGEILMHRFREKNRGTYTIILWLNILQSSIIIIRATT